MTLQAARPISLGDVLAELQIANPSRTRPISLGDADVRALAGKPSGPISLGDLLGKSSFIALTGAGVSTTSLSVLDALPGTLTTPTCTAQPVPAGASAPITYAWEHVSGSAFTVTAPTSAETAFSYVATGTGARSGVYRCRVTQGATSYYTPSVSISMTWSGA